MAFKLIAFSGLCAAIFLQPLYAQEEASDSGDIYTPILHLDGPHLYEAHGRASNLSIGDFNGDGLQDIAAVSNDEGLLRLLLRRDEVNGDERPFREEKISLGQIVRSMSVADVNGDGRTDLVMTSSPPGLVVMYQNDEGRLQKGQRQGLKTSWQTAGDLNGDQKDDILFGHERKLGILPSTDDGIELEPSQTYFTVNSPQHPPFIADLNGDGMNDIAWLSSDRQKVIMRLQTPEGRFPIEMSIETGLLRSVAAVTTEDGNDLIAAIHGKTRDTLLLKLEKPLKDEEKDSGITLSEQYTLGLTEEPWGSRAISTIAHVDDDKKQDIVIANPKAPSLLLVRQTDGGQLTVKEVPSFKGISQLAAWPGEYNEAQALLLLSDEENTLAISQADSDSGEASFPQPLQISGHPHAVAVAQSGDVHQLVVLEEIDDEHRIKTYPDFTPENTSLSYDSDGVAIDAEEEPSALSALDINRDGRDDLVVFFEFEKPVLYLQNEEAGFEKYAGNGIMTGLLDELTPQRLIQVQAEDGAGALFIKEEYARSVYIDEEDKIAITGQFNGSNSRARLTTAIEGDFREGDGRELAVLDSGNKELLVFGASQDGEANSLLTSVEVDDGDYQELKSLDLDGDGRDDILLIAPDRLAVFYTQPQHGSLETLASFETDVEDGGYGSVESLELIGGVPSELAAIEMKENMLQFFQVVEEDDVLMLKDIYHFRVFDEDNIYAQSDSLEGQAEPREMLNADLDGDGVQDVVGLMHDYIVIYYQKQAE